MKKALKEVFTGFNSLLTGMRITIGQFFKPIITVQYPHESLKMPPRFRGHIELVVDPATGKPRCFACKLCERACPSDCITVDGAKLEGAKKKSVTEYVLDFTKCSLCGSCVEACRDGAIRFSREYNLAGTSKEEFVMDLFKRLEDERIRAEAAEGRVPQTTESKPQTVDAGPAVPTTGPKAEPVQEPPKTDGATQAKPATPPQAAELKLEAK